jgi:hypothetical protein
MKDECEEHGYEFPKELQRRLRTRLPNGCKISIGILFRYLYQSRFGTYYGYQSKTVMFPLVYLYMKTIHSNPLKKTIGVK